MYILAHLAHFTELKQRVNVVGVGVEYLLKVGGVSITEVHKTILTSATYNNGFGIKGLNSIPEPELNPLILLRMLKHKILTPKKN